MSLRWGNESLFDTIGKELPQSTFYWLMISICMSITWVIYITYYNSRVLGLILTTVLNHFIKHGHIKFGSFSISVLSGKIMFRDMHWVTEDYSVRIQLGLTIFRWWRPLTLKEITEDLSHSETRLSVYLDSFEWHIYNRSSVYGELETLFGLEPTIKQQRQQQQQQQPESKTETSVSRNSGPGGVESKWQWRDLIPVIKVDISSGRIVFGNYHMSTTLSANFGDTHMVYTTKPASTPFDQFMHVLTCKMENLRVMFVPSPGSKAPEDEPPRYMGDGFVILHSNNADIYYYHDEPGLVPYEPEMVQLANGDVVARRTWPCWGMDVKCGKGTDISYGPWADKQREKLHRFFFPQNYQPLEATVLPSPGEVRMYKCFDFKMSVQAECTIDILFTKDKETQAIHMNTQAGSYLDATVPYILEADGYTTKVNGQLMNVDATSSLQFRSFLECETLQFDIETVYPKLWNDHQKWRLDLMACKSTLYLIFDHKYFFADLINDWSSKSRDDLYRFVPYTWQVCFLLKQFELITLVNEYNWIDCLGQTPENAHIAVCGDTLDVSFVLPFEDFLPPTVSLPIIFKGESAVLSLYVPEKTTSRHALLSLARTMKIVGRDGKELSEPFGSAQSEGKWRRTTEKSKGWVDCMEAPSVAINLNYKYHPMPLLDDGESSHVEPTSSHDLEEKILNPPHLIPMRPLRPRKKQPSGVSVDEFDASKLEADVISVDVEIAPSVLCAYGSLICNILHLKENYLGEDSTFTDYEVAYGVKESSVFEHVNTVATKLETFDPRAYRPFEVKVEVTLHDIQAHLVKNCKPDDPPCPWIYIERLSVEVVKKYEETKVQVLVSPAFLLASDKIKRPLPHAHLQDGHMCLSGLQIRGHAMFSHESLPIDSETLEYAWLVEVTVGDLSGRVTAPQLQMIVQSLEELVFLVEDAENSLLRPAVSEPLCHHKVCQATCSQSRDFPCPSSDDLRYTMTRVTVDGINLYLVEAGSALSVQLYPIRLSTCNLHGQNNKAGITVLVPHIKIKQYVLSLPTMHQYNGDTDLWLESGSVSLGPITVNSAMALEHSELRHIQDVFLKCHDRRSRRLDFLWPQEDGTTLAGKCGCVGGCTFFGNNRNGTRVFQPSECDSRQGLNCVMYHQAESETAIGFGQSILHLGEFIFYTPSIPSSENTLKACRRVNDVPDSETARSSITLVEQESTRSLLCLSESSEGSTSSSDDNFAGTNANEEFAEDPHPSQVVDRGIYRDKLKSSILHADRPLSDGQRESWDAGSVFYGDFSVPNIQSVSTPRNPNVLSGDEIFSSGSSPTRHGALSHGSPATVRRHDSFSSMRSLTTSQRSSLASPILHRLSSETSIQKGSSPSVTGSEKYFSCTEDADVLSNRGNDSIGVLTDYQGTSPGNQSGSFWFSRDDDPITHTVIMTSRDSDGDSSDDSDSSFVSAASSDLVHRKRHRKGAPQYIDADTIREQLGVSESHLVSEPDDITPLLNETPTQESTNVTDYVNLHNQISQPITQSPILINSYVSHMTQLKCNHWTALAPVPHLVSNMSNLPDKHFLSSASTVMPPDGQNSSLLIPQFVVKQPGFTSVTMTAKKESSFFSRMPSDSIDSEKDVNAEGERETGISDNLSEIIDVLVDGFMTSEDSISNTTAIVNLKGPIDVMISPLLLETLQRYVETVTPALSTIHLSSVVDLLHRRVSAATSHSKVLEGDDMENDISLDDIKDTDIGRGACTPRGAQKGAVNAASEQGNRTSRVQVMFSISKVNIRMLQMSLVEEVVSFSALDRVKELMCVSVFCACLDSITFTLLANNQLEKSAEPACKIPVDATTPGKNAGRPTSTDHPRGCKKVAPAPCKMREKPPKAQNSEQAVKQQKEDLVGSLNIARIHFQLRRLRQKTNLHNSHVILTTIPEHRSKVTFMFPPDEHGMGELEDIVGFIMFECGLEDIDLKGMWRWGYSPTLTMEDSLHLQQAETLLQDAQRKVTFYNEVSEEFNEDLGAKRVQRQDSDQHEKTEKPTQSSEKAENQSSGLDGPSPETEQSDGEDEVDNDKKLETSCTPLEGNASSCVLQFQTVWFNFAAPPSKKRKTESTRLDWNLLSTATTAMKAWMNPAHHLTVAGTDLLRKYKYRLNTVMACIMVEALEVQGIHVPAKGKYNRLTSRSRALQVDPSCQLMTVLRRYLAQVDLADVEASINSNSIPQFITIQKGLLALTRQWKNVLYLPRWVDNDFKSAEKLPYTFTFAIPPDPAVDVMKDDAAIYATDGAVGDDGIDTISDSFEVVDENMSLLKAEGGSFHTAQSAVQESVSRVQHQAAERCRNESGPSDPPVRYVTSGPNKLMPSLSNPVMPSTKETPMSEPQQGRATMGMRLGSFLGVTSLQSHLTRNESYISVLSVCSASGGSSVDGMVPDPTPGRASFAQHLSRLDQRTEDTDDLYRWMQRQQDFTKTAYYSTPSGMPETFTKHKGSEQSIDELPSEHSLAATLIPTAFQPVAAQVLFKPLLITLGLHIDAIKRSALMKKFGGNVSIKGALNTLRIDIVESEEVAWTPRMTGKAGGAKPRIRKTTHFNVDPPTPALLFDNFTITAAMKDNIDLQKVVPVPASLPNRNVGRHSLRSVKLAMDHMEAKPTTTKVYFDVYCHGITQHVNVPLLRLVHQFVTMIETISDTHQQLREVSSQSKDADYRRHVKNDSKGSSSSTETTSPSIQSGTPVGSPLSAQYSEGAPVDSINSQPQRPDQLSLQSAGGRSVPKSSYSKTESAVHSPLHSYAESVMVASGELSSPAVAERTIVDEITENTPKCWHTLYHLLELYSIMPETNAIDPHSSRSRLSVINEESDVTPVVASEWKENKMDSMEQLERQADAKKAPRRNTITRSKFMQSVLIGERVPLIIFGTAKVKRVRISAVLSGLKLEAEVRNVHTSATHKERVKGVMKKRSHESSVTAHVGQSMIIIREGVPPDIQTVVTVNIGQSQGLYSTFCKEAKEHNSGLVTIGVIAIDIPQHPVALHGVVYRSSKRLSCTLQEFIRPPGKVRTQESEGSLLSQQPSRHSELSEFTSNTTVPSLVSKLPQKPADDKLIAPSVVHFKAVLRGLVLGASLLPSLRARYKMEEVQCSGVTGRKPKCTVDLPAHSLSFTSKVTIPSSLPSSASINLPPVHIHGDYHQHNVASTIPDSGGLMEGHHLRAGHYLQATADVGVFEHSLTTDLLNHLVFVQKVFMKEVNELVQKVSGGDQPVSIFGDLSPKSNLSRRIEPLLYSVSLRLKGIQITATTPTSIAVRLETSVIDLDLTNRVVNNRYCAPNDSGATYVEPGGSSHKLFVKMQVDLNLALGTLLKNPMFEEAEAEFQHLASFATRFSLRNALQDEMIPDMSKDQEALLISLTRPVIYVQPVSFDKAVLVWLNYKNAYEYWNEQRAALNKEVQTATMQVFEKFPLTSHAPSTSSVATPTSNSTLFLQVTASDMGMCLPLNSYVSPGMLATTSRMIDEPTAATVMTLESTQISVCSFGSMVSKGRFQGFCLRFADDFEVSWDDWKPEKNQDVVMNAMVVPEGTYEICSRTMTVAPGNTKKNIKWMMNINWKMQGLDVHLDTNIGQRLSMLGSTLTSLARDQSDDNTDSQSEGVPKEELETTPATRVTSFSDDLPRFLFDNTIDKKTRARLIVDAMNKQARKVEELRSSTASQIIIEPEERKLNVLETAVFNDFRQDIMKRLNRQVTRATTIKEKLGLGYKPAHHRSKSVGTNVMRELKRSDSDIVESTRHASYTGILRDKQTSFDINAMAMNQRHGRTLSLDTNSLELPLKSLDSASSTQPEFPLHSMRRSSLATPSSSESFGYEEREGAENGEGAVSSLPSSLGQGTSSSEELDIFNQENLAFLAERFGTDHAGIGDTHTHHKRAPVAEPNIDFELDIKLDVDCGKCVLHPKDTETEVKSGNGKRRDSFSPRVRRRNTTGKKLNVGEIPTIKIHPSAAPTCSSTVFILPGVDIRVHYSSKMNHDTPSPDTAYTGLANPPRTPLKKANLYIWLTLQQQLSQEMLVSPVLLDFMEQALEPIPLPDNKPSSATTSRASESNAINTSASSLVATYSSFPVDIIVYFQMESSIVRFTCLPLSRVECLVRLPSLSLIFSTKRSIADDNFDGASGTDNGTNNGSFNSGGIPDVGHTRRVSGYHTEVTSGGGLSVTGCLNNFSMFIFHPYGGMTKKTSFTSLESTFRKAATGTNRQTVFDATGRKDALSLNVEFIKVNVSRSRKGIIHSDCTPGAATGSATVRPHDTHGTKSHNIVRFSAICDVGFASFNYDMRRLSEILAFPKAWYSRTLARHLFLGEEMGFGMDSTLSDDDNDVIPSFLVTPSTPLGWTQNLISERRPVDGSMHSPLSRSPGLSPWRTTSTSSANRAPSTGDTSPRPSRESSLAELLASPHAPSKPILQWETLVIFAVNLSQLDLTINMSNIMGNTMWTTKDVRSQGELSIDSSGHKNMKILAGLGESKLEAQGGIVGCKIDVQNFWTNLKIKEDPGKEPYHKVGLQLQIIETRLDYMGSSMMMGRMCDLDIVLKDEWRLDRGGSGDDDLQPLATKRPVLIFMHGDLSWNLMHLMISRSTTPDLLRMFTKLDEFFKLHIKSSAHVLSSLGPMQKPKPSKRKSDLSDKWISRMRHHRHWQKVLTNISGCKLSMFDFTLPTEGTIAGGTMTLRGNSFSLACFHGINFRCKSWALFTMDEPIVHFATESQEIINDDGETCAHIVQNLSFQLGHNMADLTERKHMATVCQLNRGHHIPPHFTSVQEWFHYAFATNELKDLYRFPEMSHDDITLTMSSSNASVASERRRRQQELNHDTEIIFVLPSLQMNFKTIHQQGVEEPREGDPKPLVECSFVTEFEDHTYITMDAESILFIHDLITSYLREKDKDGSESGLRSPYDRHSAVESPTAVLKQDYREYQCHTWVLEPTIRLISWGGKKIDPVGVDFILQKLGFQHARLTIPKWIQRGFMDPLDGILSVLVKQLIKSLKEDQTQSIDGRAESDIM